MVVWLSDFLEHYALAMTLDALQAAKVSSESNYLSIEEIRALFGRVCPDTRHVPMPRASISCSRLEDPTRLALPLGLSLNFTSSGKY